jgi:hypothetical protein
MKEAFMKKPEFENCQLPCLPYLAYGTVEGDPQPLVKRFKRTLANPWNYTKRKWLKPLLKNLSRYSAKLHHTNKVSIQDIKPLVARLVVGDTVRVLSREEIESTLDGWKELKGCAFLENMREYCGTTQKVYKSMERFLDERDYKVKKCKGIILLEGVHCQGTPVFGQCDRGCFLFWREEWLEKIA